MAFAYKKRGSKKLLVNQMLYTIIDDIKGIIREDCSIWNTQGRCLASTCGNVEHVKEDVAKFLQMAKHREMQVTERSACFSVRDEKGAILIFVIHTVKENIEIIGKLCASQLEDANRFFERRIDKNRFMQQLLLDNLLLVDIYNQAKKLHVDNEVPRIVYVVEPRHNKDNLVLETMRGMYSEESDDFVTSVDEGHFVLIKTLEEADSDEEVQDVARTIIDMLAVEAMVDARVAYGTIVFELKDVSKSYKEASMALDVGRIFYQEKNMLAYNELGIGRLIHQLPVSLCEMFLQEVFHGNAVEQFDKETLNTVNAFFENNLNISETARQMYLHRNTLGYRLDKITKTTGLDVKKFDDALTFKIALMVSEHMKFIRSQS